MWIQIQLVIDQARQYISSDEPTHEKTKRQNEFLREDRPNVRQPPGVPKSILGRNIRGEEINVDFLRIEGKVAFGSPEIEKQLDKTISRSLM